MTGKVRGGNPVQVGDLASQVLDPVLRRRAGISVGLVASWEEIVGPHLASRSRPERIHWQRRASADDPFQPGTLVIACGGAAALQVQHETSEIVARINAFLGFPAIARVRIVQKPVAETERPARPKPRVLDEAERAKLARQVGGIEDEGLRASLEKLGETLLGRRPARR